MEDRTLGRNGPIVGALGLGCMGMSGAYGPSDPVESIATIHAALDAGVTLLDTGDFYGMGHNELLIAEALKGRDRGNVQISVNTAPSAVLTGAGSASTTAPRRRKPLLPIR
jgi:pyridoxine 4-dehydrogenase